MISTKFIKEASKAIQAESGKPSGKAAMIAAINKNVQKEITKNYPGRDGTPIAFVAAGNEHLLSFGWLATGNAAVDGITQGGFPRGSIFQFYGAEGVGKTRLSFDTIAYNQQQDPDFWAMYIHLESRAFPLEAALASGVNLERLLVINAMASADKTFNIAFKYLWNAETSSPQEYEGKPLIDLLVIDSVAAVEPEAEIISIIGGKVGDKKKEGKGMEGSEVALQARLMSKFFRFICGAGALGQTALCLINQERVDVGGYNTPRKATGGLAVGYYVKTSIKMKRDLLYEGKAGQSPVIGQEVILETVKNNTGRAHPFQKDSYKVIYGKGVDTITPLIMLAKERGIIIETSAGRYVIPALNPATGEIEPAVVDAKNQPVTGEKIQKEGELSGKEVLEARVRANEWLSNYLQNEIAGRMTEETMAAAPATGGDLDEAVPDEDPLAV